MHPRSLSLTFSLGCKQKIWFESRNQFSFLSCWCTSDFHKASRETKLWTIYFDTFYFYVLILFLGFFVFIFIYFHWLCVYVCVWVCMSHLCHTAVSPSLWRLWKRKQIWSWYNTRRRLCTCVRRCVTLFPESGPRCKAASFFQFAASANHRQRVRLMSSRLLTANLPNPPNLHAHTHMHSDVCTG